MNIENITDQNIFEKYQRIKQNKKRLPTKYDFTENEWNTIKDHFVSMIGLYKHFHDKPIHGNQWIPDDIFLTEIKELANKLGFPPSTCEYPRAESARSRFKTDWHDLLRLAGVKATYAKDTTISKEEIIYKAKKIFKGKAYCPGWRYLQKKGLPVSAIPYYWDTFTDFRHEMNIPSKREYYYNQTFSKIVNSTNDLIKANSPINRESLTNATGLSLYQVDLAIRKVGGIAKLKNIAIKNDSVA